MSCIIFSSHFENEVRRLTGRYVFIQRILQYICNGYASDNCVGQLRRNTASDTSAPDTWPWGNYLLYFLFSPVPVTSTS